MSESPNYIYEFGPFRVDPENRLLLRDGQPVPLKPKVIDTLLVLVEQSGRVVTKDELMHRIWPDTTVEENNLTQNISILRKVLGQAPEGRQYIQTIPRRGYLFAVNVIKMPDSDIDLILERHTRSRIVIEEEQEEAEHTAKTMDMTEAARLHFPARRQLRRRTLGILVLMIGVLGAGAAWVYFSRLLNQTQTNLLSNMGIVPLTSWKSEPREAGPQNSNFSHDGTKIAFSSNEGGYNDLWIKPVDGGNRIQITNDEWYNESPKWSPGDERIAFVSNQGDRAGIWSIDPFGGAPPELLKAFDSDSGWPRLRHWSKDGTTIYYELNSNLFAFNIISKQTSQITNFDLLRPMTRNFSLSPDEDLIAYVDRKDEKQDIWVMPVQGGEPIRITNDRAEDEYPVWHTDGKRIIFSSNRSDINQICVGYLDGREPTQITFGDTSCDVSSISSDGTRILYTVSKEESDIWGVLTDSGEEFQITNDVGLELWPDTSSDGKNIAYQKTTLKAKITNSVLLRKAAAITGQPIRLSSNGSNVKWSSDGRTIAFLRPSNTTDNTNKMLNIWTVAAAGGQERQLTTEGVSFTGFDGLPYNRKQTSDFSWSPDSSKIAYCSNRSGRSNIWTISADGSNDTIISNNTDPYTQLSCPLWSPDGERMAYMSSATDPSGNGKITWGVLVTESDKSRTLFQSYAILKLVGWSQSGTDVFIALVKNRNKYLPAIMQISLLQVSREGVASEIADIPFAYFNSIKLSPDRQSIAFVSRQGRVDNIWIIPVSGGNARKLTNNIDPLTYYSSLTWSPDGETIYYDRQSSWNSISMIEDFR